MVVDERARHELFGRLEDVLGAEHAVTLMEHLPPVGWADLATKHDLSLVRHDLATEIGLVRHDVAAQIGSLRQEVSAQIGSLRQEVSAEISLVRRDLAALEERLDLRIDGAKQDIVALLHAEISKALTGQTKTIMFAVLGALTSMGALVFAAARF